jgi:hypothetical protein
VVNISLKKNGKNAPGGDVPQASKSFTFFARHATSSAAAAD